MSDTSTAVNEITDSGIILVKEAQYHVHSILRTIVPNGQAEKCHISENYHNTKFHLHK